MTIFILIEMAAGGRILGGIGKAAETGCQGIHHGDMSAGSLGKDWVFCGGTIQNLCGQGSLRLGKFGFVIAPAKDPLAFGGAVCFFPDQGDHFLQGIGLGQIQHQKQAGTAGGRMGVTLNKSRCGNPATQVDQLGVIMGQLHCLIGGAYIKDPVSFYCDGLGNGFLLHGDQPPVEQNLIRFFLCHSLHLLLKAVYHITSKSQA